MISGVKSTSEKFILLTRLDRRPKCSGAYRSRYNFSLNTVFFSGILQIESGQTVAFVGHSGCGKSTLTGLIMRFYEPERGVVTIDGRPIHEINIGWLRNSVSPKKS